MTLVPKTIQKLREKEIEDIPLIIGGIILKSQVPGLLKMGVSRVFLPGTAPEEIVQSIREVVSGSD
jgi:methylmalonyl-CoA mutase C-terminal domain/subunit